MQFAWIFNRKWNGYGSSSGLRNQTKIFLAGLQQRPYFSQTISLSRLPLKNCLPTMNDHWRWQPDAGINTKYIIPRPECLAQYNTRAGDISARMSPSWSESLMATRSGPNFWIATQTIWFWLKTSLKMRELKLTNGEEEEVQTCFSSNNTVLRIWKPFSNFPVFLDYSPNQNTHVKQ